jgi:hypothetical protein
VPRQQIVDEVYHDGSQFNVLPEFRGFAICVVARRMVDEKFGKDT